MKTKRFLFFVLGMAFCWIALGGLSEAGTVTYGFTTIDPPGSTETYYPQWINNSGVIAGYYYGNWTYGFIRDAVGNFTTISLRNAALFIYGINDFGAAVGHYEDIYGKHGFLQDGEGNISPIDFFGANNTTALQINNSGVIVGYYSDGSGTHGFFGEAPAKFSPFDFPGTDGVTWPKAINDNGEIVGYYYGPDGRIRGFLRDTRGNFTTIDPTGNGLVYIYGINDSGAIVGTYASSNLTHSFLLDAADPAGTYTKIDFPSASVSNALLINNSGVIVGYYLDKSDNAHGFIRDATGNFTTIDPPGATAACIYGINDFGAIVGSYTDANGQHGFLATPLTQMASFVINEAKIEWKEKPDDDKIMAKGSFTLPANATVNPNDPVTFTLGKFYQTITMISQDNGKKWEYKRPKGSTGIKEMKIEWKKSEASFEVHVDDANLGLMNWPNPLDVSLQVGNLKGTVTILMEQKKDNWEYHQ